MRHFTMKGAIVFISFIAIAFAKKFRWCNLSEAEQRKCAELSKALQAVLPPTAKNSFTKLSCIQAHNTKDCIKKIRGNKADAISLDAGDIYTAARFYDLTVAAKEMYKDGGCLYSVAVVRNESLDIQKLKGKRSCHNGARRTAGWNIPLGFLLSRNYLHWHKNQTVIEATSKFFSAACAPGAGTSFPNLCRLCQGKKSYNRDRNYFCETTDNEPYYGSEGALRCLLKENSDVAFLDSTALANINASETAKYKLLCPDGTQAELKDFRNCHLGRGPGSAIVTRHNYRKIARKFLAVAQHLFGRNGKQSQRFQLFSSTGFNGRNLMFQDATEKLLLLADDTDINQVLGLDYIALLKGLGHGGSSLENSIVRWCCISAAEQSKCEEWALNTKSNPLVCIRATSMSDCIEMIKKDEVDAASLDASHAYIAGNCGLAPVVTEYYGDKCPEASGKDGETHFEAEVLPPVYALAVVKKASRGETIFNLAGRRSCHGHLYSPAGWLLLTKYTVRPDRNSTDICDINKAFANYFRKGCMPGMNFKGKLCKVCIGREQAGMKLFNQRCAANHDEFYYGNLGALRCLVGNPSGKSFGDVAFLEHHNVMENIESLSEWADGWSPDHFELLCPGGERAPVTEWERCNLGSIPPNIVMTRSVIATKIYDFLMKSQDHFGVSSDSEFQLFQSRKYGEKDLLFKDSTKCLAHATHLDYMSILGEEFSNLAESVFSCTESEILEFCTQNACSTSQV
ncbi:saxiphilin-like [Chiloscyllium punctatum]|uniref:saxiphilin-like n=1 Tax=Chiloscyllium punctatum TaxID=137246 RepID=UPI003B63A4BD